jgi:hypothetical protein
MNLSEKKSAFLESIISEVRAELTEANQSIVKSIGIANSCATSMEAYLGNKDKTKKEALRLVVKNLFVNIMTGKESKNPDHHFLKQNWPPYKNVFSDKPAADFFILYQSNPTDVVLLYAGTHSNCPVYRY